MSLCCFDQWQWLVNDSWFNDTTVLWLNSYFIDVQLNPKQKSLKKFQIAVHFVEVSLNTPQLQLDLFAHCCHWLLTEMTFMCFDLCFFYVFSFMCSILRMSYFPLNLVYCYYTMQVSCFLETFYLFRVVQLIWQAHDMVDYWINDKTV